MMANGEKAMKGAGRRVNSMKRSLSGKEIDDS